jgi:hypothetical protein
MNSTENDTYLFDVANDTEDLSCIRPILVAAFTRVRVICVRAEILQHIVCVATCRHRARHDSKRVGVDEFMAFVSYDTRTNTHVHLRHDQR